MRSDYHIVSGSMCHKYIRQYVKDPIALQKELFRSNACDTSVGSFFIGQVPDVGGFSKCTGSATSKAKNLIWLSTSTIRDLLTRLCPESQLGMSKMRLQVVCISKKAEKTK